MSNPVRRGVCARCAAPFALLGRNKAADEARRYCTERCSNIAKKARVALRRPRRWRYAGHEYATCAALLDAASPGWRERAAARAAARRAA